MRTRFRFLLAIAALVLGQAGSAQAESIYGLTNLQQLVTFDSVGRTITSNVGLQGFSITGEILVSIDVRPATGQLYGLSNQNNLYVINPLTGARTQIGTTLSTAPVGSLKSIDFNPTVDRIRVLSSGGSPNNLRLHPDTGAVAFTDTALAFSAGDTNAGDAPAVVNGAYTNSFAGATTTTLYDLDAGNDILATQVPANNGTLQTVGPIGFNLATAGGFTGFDISGQTGLAYLVGNNLTGGLTANTLYSLNLSTGAASSLGAIAGASGSFRDIAVAPVPEPSTFALATIAFGICGYKLRRRM